MALSEGDSGDTSFAHSPHRLVLLANLDQTSSLPLAALQLPSMCHYSVVCKLWKSFSAFRNTPVAQGDRGRHRALLCTLYDAYAAFGKESLMVHHVLLTWTDTACKSWRKP